MMKAYPVVLAFFAAAIVDAQAGAQIVPGDSSEAFFSSPGISRLEIEVAPETLEKLKAEPRSYVKATIREDGRISHADVAVKLKGAAGSFRDWDDRPALTLNFRKYREGRTFHGLVKFHLNNSAQDDTYLNEILCSELFRQAGIPAPRVSFARVRLNGRDVGLYVLREGFDRPFLERWFADPTGNLYDGGFCQDVDAELEKDGGSGPDDRSDLRAIVEAASDPDPDARARRLEELVDLDEFGKFMAMERMTSHWDGYCNNANNYRIYFDPRRRKAVFLPHGMDQMFGDPAMGLFDPTDKIVSRVVIESDSLRRRYREHLEKLIPLMSPADPLLRRVDEIDRRLAPALEAIDPDRAAERRRWVAELKERLVARGANLRAQMAEAEETTLAFDERGVATLQGWGPVAQTENAILEEVETTPGKRELTIKAEQPCIASWRRRVLLDRGTYTFRASARTEGVVEREESEFTGVGAGISGVPRDQHRHGTNPPEELSHRFEVEEDRKQVVLVIELRALAGQAWFDASSLRLTRDEQDRPGD